MKIKVIIADDHAVVRTGLQLILAGTTDIDIVDEATTGNELLKKLKSNTDIDVVILDIHMPGKDVIDTLTEFRTHYPNLPVLIFTMYDENQYFIRLFKNGAWGYISKESDHNEIIEAIRTVHTGKKYYSKTQADLIANKLFDKGERLLHEKLTDREFQILCMISEGVRNSQIAKRLNISKNTISNHRNNILKKMDLENNVEIAHYAVKHNLTPD